jgi:hypothetical protein
MRSGNATFAQAAEEWLRFVEQDRERTRMIAKADVRGVQEWMGHADIQTTMTYLAPRAEDARLVAEAFALSEVGTSGDGLGRLATEAPSPILEVIEATPTEGHVLRIGFSDGLVGELDCAFLLAGGVGVELHDPAYFRQATVDPELRTVVWPNGFDPAPELLHNRLEAQSSKVSSAA